MTGRWTYLISAAGVIVLAAAAFTLSYDALHQLALDSLVRPGLAWMWPVVIDGTIVVALLTVLAAKRAAVRAGYPWTLAGLFSGVGGLQHRACARPAGRAAGVRHGPGRAGAHHPPAHAAGELAAAHVRSPGRTRTPGRPCTRTGGRLPTRTPAPARRPHRTAVRLCGSERAGWRAGTCASGL